jgi:hypothetical protein
MYTRQQPERERELVKAHAGKLEVTACPRCGTPIYTGTAGPAKRCTCDVEGSTQTS